MSETVARVGPRWRGAAGGGRLAASVTVASETVARVSSHRARGVALALLADRILGEPPARLHPVAWFGRAMEKLERRSWQDSRWTGTLVASAGVLGVGASARIVGSVSLATTIALAGRALGEAAGEVCDALEAGDLAGARSALRALVGRDTVNLDETEILRAMIESLAENTVDAIVAPIFWAMVAGAEGALGYRAVNTLDSLFGHRNDRYLRFGWASARLDDLANWVPARLTALMVMLIRPSAISSVLEVLREDAPLHPSPNSGVAEGAFAAALGVRLGGESSYGGVSESRPVLFARGRPPERDDVSRARRLSTEVAVVTVGCCQLAAWLGGRGMRRLYRDELAGAKGELS